jgi:hypothetical protein
MVTSRLIQNSRKPDVAIATLMGACLGAAAVAHGCYESREKRDVTKPPVLILNPSQNLRVYALRAQS